MDKEEAWILEEKYSGIESPEFETDKARLAAGEPVAYVIGWQPFLGLAIYLDSKPLIPRTETEYWVEQLIDTMGAKIGRTLDLCAGSGAIGCALLAQLPEARVSFGEVDPAHEATIRKNIHENSLDESRADIRIGDLFEPFKNDTFDLIVANPPYIPSGRALAASVAGYEPALALYAGRDGLELIRRMAAELPIYLTKGGQAWVECDRAHAKEAQQLFVARGFEAQIKDDQFGQPRVIVISWPD